jgi:hypothetical protein
MENENPVFRVGNNILKIFNAPTPERELQVIDALLVKDSPTPLAKCLPASEYKRFTPEEIQWLGWKFGIFQFPTEELIAFLKQEMGPQALEIAAGGGHIGKYLPGVIQTDSKLHDKEDVQDIYRVTGQNHIKYPAFVEKLEAMEAIRKYKPDVILGSWTVEKEVSPFGINEQEVINNCKRYFLIGNEATHEHKSIIKSFSGNAQRMMKIKAPWLVSKAAVPAENCLYIFAGSK